MTEQNTPSLINQSERVTKGEFYPIAPEDNIPVHYHNDFVRGLSKRHFEVDIDSVNGQQITIISKRQ